MPRALWKGSITFGLVYIPVALYPASREESLDFDWLDKRDMAPVGYKRVNKNTGKEVTKENIVKGLKYEEGRYALLTDEEIRASNAKTTQTVELLAFVDADAVPPQYFERPYYLAPTQRGEKVYALLRETLKKEKKIGIANVVIQTKQHLAALLPEGRALLLNTLRWATEIRTLEELPLPAEGVKGAKLKDAELTMASQLVKSMAREWEPGQYHDTFRDEIMALVKKKVQQGKTAEVQIEAPEAERPSAQIYDLTELLKKSLKSGSRAAPRGARLAKNQGDDSDARDDKESPPRPTRTRATAKTGKTAVTARKRSAAGTGTAHKKTVARRHAA